jgi:hypothetical protein
MIKPITLTLALFLGGCAEYMPLPLDYVGICRRTAKVMGNPEPYKTPPIVFVRDSYALAEMFPKLRKEGEMLLGVYWCGMIYLSQPDLDSEIVSHEISHRLGADEKQARAFSRICR